MVSRLNNWDFDGMGLWKTIGKARGLVCLWVGLSQMWEEVMSKMSWRSLATLIASMVRSNATMDGGVRASNLMSVLLQFSFSECANSLGDKRR